MVIMIAFIKGTVVKIFQSSFIIENNDIGYLINVSASTLSKLNHSEKVKIYTYQIIREDENSLYGFLTSDELDMFEKLISVSGIGPKGAISMLSFLSPSEITLAIVSEDIKTLSKAQGVGKKTASRLILELKDKVSNSETHSTSIDSNNSNSSFGGQSSAKKDAIEALISLGYNRSESVKLVMEIAMPDMTLEQIIKHSLKKLSS